VKHLASPRFWRPYRDLPQAVRRLADKNFALLKSDPHHPSLHFKKIDRLWSVRVGAHYRALVWMQLIQLYGFGLDPMRIMTSSCNAAAEQSLAACGATACFSSSLVPSALEADRAPQLKAVVRPHSTVDASRLTHFVGDNQRR
jgi:hypothetical protein